MFSRSELVVSTEPAHFAMVRPMAVFHFLSLLSETPFFISPGKAPLQEFSCFCMLLFVAIALVSLDFTI